MTPHELAFAEMARAILEASGVDDAEPGSMTTVETGEGLELYVERRQAGRTRVGVVLRSELDRLAADIARRRN